MPGRSRRRLAPLPAGTAVAWAAVSSCTTCCTTLALLHVLAHELRIPEELARVDRLARARPGQIDVDLRDDRARTGGEDKHGVGHEDGLLDRVREEGDRLARLLAERLDR